jgi:hypothetical protein
VNISVVALRLKRDAADATLVRSAQTPLRMRSWYPPFAKNAKNGAPHCVGYAAGSEARATRRLQPSPRYHRPWCPRFENREAWGSLICRGASRNQSCASPPAFALLENCELMLPLYAAEVSSAPAFRADLRQTRGRHSAGVPENARADFSVAGRGE